MDNGKGFFLNAKNLWNCIKLNSKDSKAQSITIEPKKPILYIINESWIFMLSKSTIAITSQ